MHFLVRVEHVGAERIPTFKLIAKKPKQSLNGSSRLPVVGPACLLNSPFGEVLANLSRVGEIWTLVFLNWTFIE